MPIPVNQARSQFTQQLVGIYRQIPEVKNFLNIFFPDAPPSLTRYLAWQIEREGEPVAVDVIRGSEGNRNTFDITSEKIVDPPFYSEYTDITSTDLYYRAFGTQQVDESVLAEYNAVILRRLQSMQNKIARALELQRSQILNTGIVTMKNGDNVDFKRKAASMVDLNSGNYWDQATVSPYATLETGCTFLRNVGKADGSNFIAIMGQSAYNTFLLNTIVQNRSKEFQMKLDDLKPPFREANGSAYHGRISCGSYTVDIFTYPEVYDLTTASPNTSTPYIPTTNVVLLPESPKFITGYGAVPFLPKTEQTALSALQMPSIQPGKYVIGEYIDGRSKSWNVDISCAGIALPTAIDQIYTIKAVAA